MELEYLIDIVNGASFLSWIVLRSYRLYKESEHPNISYEESLRSAFNRSHLKMRERWLEAQEKHREKYSYIFE